MSSPFPKFLLLLDRRTYYNHEFEAICRGLGVSEEHLKVVVPLPKNMAEIKETIEQEINYHGVSVIIPRRECMQTLQRHLKQKKAAK